MDKSNLIVPIYLNQKIVFDLLAILEDGFSQMKNIQKSISGESNTKSSIGGEIGTSNIFAFLSVKLKANLAEAQKDSNSELVNEEKIHTPVSLFSRLLSQIENKELIKEINDIKDFDKIKPGDFIRFNGTLEKNPIISFMESLERMMELVLIFDENSQNLQQSQKGGNKVKSKDPNKVILEQMKSLTESLKIGGMIDLLCNINNDKNAIAVLQTYFDYFNNNTMNEIIDGEFTVVGKAVKIITDEKDGEINLLRNTSLSLANEKLLSQFTGAFTNSGMTDAGIDIPEFETKIKGNGILLIPIAIYS